LSPQPIGPAENAIDVSVSCGIAALVDMPQGLARSVAAAEIACKTAKNHGRNRVQLYAQVIVPLQDRTLAGGYEILVRVRDRDGEMLASGTLMAAAGRYQLLPSVDRWVATRALRTLAPHRGRIVSRGISLSINVSGQSIADESFILMLTEVLRAAALPAGSIIIEISEQAAVTNLVRAREMIQRLRTLGCRIAIDDFGTGTNSLTNLKALQISRVKIDGSFVRDIVTDRRSQATIRGIVELCKGMSLETVAEHDENEAIADAVRRIGVDYAQGFAFGKPELIDTVLADPSNEESQRLRRVVLEL
jgi:EAL domain-containing protein (putative c-di-GMP-specific phosphodiesterase class I)